LLCKNVVYNQIHSSAIIEERSKTVGQNVDGRRREEAQHQIELRSIAQAV